MGKFQGFPRDLPRFLEDLAANNSKAWFDRHRDRYEAAYLAPAKAFVSAIAPKLRRLSQDIRAEPRVNGAIMRINRDTRFSKDKTPYKTALYIHFLEGAAETKNDPAGLLMVAADRLVLGVGAWGFTKDRLAAWRAALVDTRQGPALRRAIAKAEKAGFTDLGGAHYKTVPGGFDADHPSAELLKFNGFFLSRSERLPKALHGPEFVDHAMDAYRACRPVWKWLVDVPGRQTLASSPRVDTGRDAHAGALSP